ASQVDFDVLQQGVAQLDIRPLQVLIEVMIVEARHDRSFSFGSDLFLPPQSVDKGNGTVDASNLGGGLGDLVIHLMNLGHAEIDATLRAAASKGEVQIVSRPVLLASNNTEARLLVGSQVPFVQVSRSLPTDTPTRDQVVQYRDVGTKLTVRPTINQDGYVSLLIQQEVNAATTEVLIDAPVAKGGGPVIIGRSPSLRRALVLAERYARTRLPILIVGATGTGKELLAQHIHERSGRPGPFVDVNSCALPLDMVESLLFGH